MEAPSCMQRTTKTLLRGARLCIPIYSANVIALCVHLTGLRDSQIAGKTLFLGVSEGVP
jgi:hypothetical protein